MIGKYPAKMDEKNRLFVPAKLRAELGGTFFVTVGYNGGRRCLTVYTEEGWNRLCDKYDQLPLAMKNGHTSTLFANAVECNPHKHFRFTLTQELLNYAGIDRNVTIVGRAGQAEIWDQANYAAYELEALTPENLMASLEAIGL